METKKCTASNIEIGISKLKKDATAVSTVSMERNRIMFLVMFWRTETKMKTLVF